MKGVWLINFKLRNLDRLLAFSNQIMRNIPNELGLKGKELLLNIGIPAAKRKIIEDKVSYNHALEESFEVITKKPSGHHYRSTLINTQPYAYSIDSGQPDKLIWSASESELEKWREAKGIYGGDPFFVEVGKSGGKNRINGKPYPLGVHFMKAAYSEIFGNVPTAMEEALQNGLRGL